MKHIFRQTNDPEVELGLEETRPFFWFLILVLVLLYGLALYSVPALRQPAQFLPFTTLFFLHIALHWYMPYLATQGRKLAVYFVVQVFLITLLILISRQPSLVIGLYTTLAGETIGILDDWRRSLVAIVVYLGLIGLTYGLIWGWGELPDWLGTALVALLFVLVYVLLFLRQMNARAESQALLADLQEAHAQLAAYAQQVERLTLEAERQRMARELHDTLAQGVAGLVLQLEALEASLERGNAEKAERIAGQAKERARSTLAEARRAIDDLRAIEASAPEAIAREVDRFRLATGIPCALVLPPDLTLPARQGEHAVRCVSEGLANVARHAQATEASVVIVEENGRVVITISDNGQGFAVSDSAPQGHYGLLGLRERARLAGGELSIASEPGAGTTLRMVLPAGPAIGETV
jgi:NarL family two-component system sensor histidine kinase YdfH